MGMSGPRERLAGAHAFVLEGFQENGATWQRNSWRAGLAKRRACSSPARRNRANAEARRPSKRPAAEQYSALSGGSGSATPRAAQASWAGSRPQPWRRGTIARGAPALAALILARHPRLTFFRKRLIEARFHRSGEGITDGL